MTIRAVVFDLGHTLWDFAPRATSRRLRVLRLHERLEDAIDDVPSPRTLDKAVGVAAQGWFESWDTDQVNLEQPPTEQLLSEAREPNGARLRAVRRYPMIGCQPTTKFQLWLLKNTSVFAYLIVRTQLMIQRVEQ